MCAVVVSDYSYCSVTYIYVFTVVLGAEVSTLRCYCRMLCCSPHPLQSICGVSCARVSALSEVNQSTLSPISILHIYCDATLVYMSSIVLLRLAWIPVDCEISLVDCRVPGSAVRPGKSLPHPVSPRHSGRSCWSGRPRSGSPVSSLENRAAAAALLTRGPTFVASPAIPRPPAATTRTRRRYIKQLVYFRGRRHWAIGTVTCDAWDSARVKHSSST